MKKFILIILMVVLCACSTSKINQEKTISVSGQIVLIDNNGNADIDISNTDFINEGFKYGDSVDVELENGYKLIDIPFLSGMYVEYGKAMVYGKASKDKVSLLQKYKSFVQNNEVSEQMTYTISLNEAGKYSNIENVGNLVSSNNYDDYNDEIKFSNFREVRVGDIKENRLYRSASVIDNSENRVEYTSDLAIKNGIKTIINIINSKENYDGLLTNLVGDTKTLIENTVVINAPISNDYQSQENNIMIAKGLNELISNECPCLIHCLQGKDRTGYELAIIEALCNATYEEIIDDYMLSYDNYYGINKDNDIEKYNYIKQSNIDAMLRFITGSDDLSNVDLSKQTRKFLINYSMSEENIDALISMLCD